MNPALPKPKLGIKDMSEVNKRKGGVNLAILKLKPGNTKKGRAG